MTKLEILGSKCKLFREKLGLYQYDVASDVNCSKENVSSFECGRNNNALIYDWYVQRGLYLSEICKVYHDGKTHAVEFRLTGKKVVSLDDSSIYPVNGADYDDTDSVEEMIIKSEEYKRKYAKERLSSVYGMCVRGEENAEE